VPSFSQSMAMVFHEIETGIRMRLCAARHANSLTVVVEPDRDSVRVVERLSVRVDAGCSCSQCAAPGDVMVPWNEPENDNVTRFARRTTVKLPWAPVNRPVPPVTV